MDTKKHHIICIPAPAQGHINPMTKLSKLFHCKGFHITFIHTEFNFDRQAKLSGSNSPFLGGIDGFCFETIPDGLPADNKREAKDLPALSRAMLESGGEPMKALRCLLLKLVNSSVTPPITCVVLDAQMNFAYDVIKELGIRVLLFHSASACAVLAYLHYDELVRRGLFPLTNKDNLTDEFLDTPIDWIDGLIEGAKLKHLPSFQNTSSADENMFIKYNIMSSKSAIDERTIILNTLDDLEHNALEGIKTKIPNIRTVGPLTLLCQQAKVQEFGSTLWKEDSNCIDWLDKRSPKSVIYVNYGSLTTLTFDQLEEFAWGLANSKQHFLWIIRDDLVNGVSKILSKEYMEEIKERGLVSGWCDQEKVLEHPSVAVFLTHCGWNSILESVCEGIPMICWPFFADQTTNCLYTCRGWRIGMEIGEGDVTRERVEEVVREMMEGEKGKVIRENAMELKNKALRATKLGGSSYNNFEDLVEWLIK